MLLPAAARDFYDLQQRVSETTGAEVSRHWRSMGDDFDASWKRIAPAILSSLTVGQHEAAKAAAEYLPAVLGETNLHDRPSGDLVPESLVGWASDGRPLETLAYQGVVTAKQAISQGATTSQALDQGGQWMNLMGKLQVADAARVAVGIGSTARHDIAGNIRVANPPVCQRCAILAGRFYRWSQGFDRHPHDDCTMMPAKSAGWARSEGFVLDPMAAYRAGQIKDLTEAQVKAIENGADINKVVNAYRGMSTTATESVIKTIAPAVEPIGVQPGMPDLLGFMSPASRNQRPELTRLTPEGIYGRAGDNRDEAIRLLREHGFIN